MTHDPYCAYEWHLYEHDDPTYNCDESCDSIKCTCEYVAVVRSDTLAKCIAVLDAHHPRCTEPCDLCAEWSVVREEMEALAGNTFAALSLDAQEALWRQVKTAER